MSGDTERARALKAAVEYYYSLPGNGCGGNLHLVLDDGNLEDCHIEFCRATAETARDHDGVAIAIEMMRCSWERCFVYGSDPTADDEDCEL